MRALLLFLGLMSGWLHAAPVELLTPWSMALRPGHPFETRPNERTRPVVVGDIVYFSNLAGEVLAIHRKQAYVLWRVSVPGGVAGALAYGRSKVFVGDIQGNLTALNSRDGSVAWTFKATSEWLVAPLVHRDKVYALAANDELYVLSESSGKELWHHSQRGDEKMVVRGGGMPAQFGSDVYVGFADGHVVALGAGDGRVIWDRKLRSGERFYDIDTPPYVDEERVIVSSYSGQTYSLNRLNGETQWVFPVGSYGGFLVEGDRVFFAGLDGHFYCVARKDGSLIWKKPYESGVGLQPSKVGDVLVFTTSGDPLYVLDPKSGDVLATHSLGAGTLAAAGVASGESVFYCLSNYGNLFAFEIRPIPPARQRPLRVIPVPSASEPILREPAGAG